MADDWGLMPLFDVADVLFGYPFDSKLFNSERVGLPLIRIRNLQAPETCLFTTEAEFPASVRVEPGDLLVGMDAEFRPHRWNGPKALLNQRVCKIVPKSEHRLDLEYLRVALRAPLLNIENAKTGTTVIHLNKSDLERVEVPWPQAAGRRAIAHILGTLDDKIELNRQMNETLEAIARALFKSWFVDFDPVRAKAEGRDPGVPQPLADLFPDSFEDSELGQIPRGWAVVRFSDTIEIVGGGTPKTAIAEYWGGDIPWFSVVDAPSDSEVWVLDTEKHITRAGVDNSSTSVLPLGTTIISARGTVGRVALVGVPMAMNQSCYGLRGLAGARGFFNYYSTRELVARLQRHAHGSVFDTITRDTLAGVTVVVPTGRLIEYFEQRVGPILDRVRVGLLESRTLAALRNALLPKLISGELRVRDVERFAKAAVQ